MGPEVTRAAVLVLEAAAEVFDLRIRPEEHPVGWAAVQADEDPLPASTLAACTDADAVFLGAVGHPDAVGVSPEKRPEAGLLRLRTELRCYTNLRPLRLPDTLIGVSPLREERIRGVDLVIVRELAGGLYYGTPRGVETREGERSAHNTLRYGASEIRRVARAAFRLAEGRGRRLLSVDKSNVLETSRLWREVVEEVALEHPTVALEHMLIDRAALELVLRPNTFDVILTENLFGDILSDEVAGVAGSLGLLPSASLGDGTPLFEPVHGSAPALAGEGTANPVGAILSMAMLLEHALDAPEAARAVGRAVEECFASGLRTADLAGPGEKVVGTDAFAKAAVQIIATEG